MLRKVLFITPLLLVPVFSICAYLSRDRTINFAEIMPPRFEICGLSVGQNDKEYEVLSNWFLINMDGWKNTLVSYIPNHEFHAESMVVNVLPSAVVVNYQDEHEWSQVVKNTNTADLITPCK